MICPGTGEFLFAVRISTATMAADPVFVDTNVLVYASPPSASQHLAARTAIDRLQEEGAALWISSQVLREYLAVVTRPQAGAPALQMVDALADVRRFIALLTWLKTAQIP